MNCRLWQRFSMIHVREMKNPLFSMRSKAHIIINLKHIKVFRVCTRRLIYLYVLLPANEI